MDNEIQLEFMTQSFTECLSALQKLTSQVSKTTTILAGLDKSAIKFGSDATKNLKQASDGMDNLQRNTSTTLKKMEGFNTISNFIGNMVHNVVNLAKKFLTLANYAVDYSEELNLFNVVFKNDMNDIETSFSSVGLKAERFQQTLHEAFGTNLMETRRFQALYQSMGENMGIVTEKAEVLSTNLTKLTYDIASLYNASEKDVGQALKAGIYAGQTKPLRQFGVDVTQTSMQPIMQELGLEKSISELTQAEKQILRYISVLKQSSVAHGDFANTIESPANQLKIFKQQLVECKIALGNLFIGMYAKILPYANALLMVIREVAKAIASFFGIKIQDYNSGIASSVDAYDDLEDSLDGVGSSAGSASNAVKELKRQVLGFDQINNLTTPTPTNKSSGGGSGGGVSGGIDQKLLDAISGYENGMEKVRMKANDIRDSIMKWLGFTKETDEKTGEVHWKYEGLGTTIKNLKDWFSDLNGPAKIFVGLGVGVALASIFKWGSKIVGLTGLPTIMKALTSGTSTILKLATGGASGGALSSLGTAFTGLAESLGLSVGALAGIIVAIVVAIGSIIGVLVHAYKTDEDFRKSIEDLGKAIQECFEPLKPYIDMAIEGFKMWGTIIKELVIGALKTLASMIKIMFQSMIEGWTTEFKILGDILRGDFSQVFVDLAEGVKKQGELIKKYIKEWGEHIEDFLDNVSGQSHKTMTNRDLLDLEGVSKETKKKLRFIMDDFDKLETYTNEIKWNPNHFINDDDIRTVTSRLKSLNEEYSKKIEEMRKESKSVLSGLADTEGYDELMKKINEYYDNAGKTMEERSNKIKEIYENASKEHRNITTEEYKEIQRLENLMKEGSITTLSQSQEEQKVLLEQMRLEAGSITLEQASEIIKNSAKARDKTIENAKEQYTKQLAEAQKLKEAGIINQEEYDKMVNNAKETRDKTIQEAKDQHEGVYNEFAKSNEDIAKYIDNDTGKVKSNWDIFRESISNKWEETCKNVSKWVDKYVTDPNSKDSLKYKWNKFWEDLKTMFNDAKQWIGEKWNNIWGSLKSIHIPKPHVWWGNDGASASGTVKKVLEALNLPTSLPALHVDWYASGGIPSRGTLFGAGENGPEVVGHIGNRSEVLNQSQLASVMYEAVSRALTNSDFGGIEFHAHTDEGVVIDRINRITRQTGECPLKI